MLLTRVGGFYEMYFEHAEEIGPLLNLKVGQKKTNAGDVPMVCYLRPPTLHPLTECTSLDSHSSNWIDILRF